MQTEDIYSSPKAALIDTNTPESENAFFSSSILKLAILYFATFGLYSLYWFYKNWKNYKDRTHENIMPIPRAIFYIFFTHSLFRAIKSESDDRGIDSNWNAAASATVFVLLTIASNVLDRISRTAETIGIVDYIGFAILFVLVWPLISAQRVVNRVNDDPEGKLNGSLSIYNFIFILLGLPLWVLVLAGFFNIDLSAVLGPVN